MVFLLADQYFGDIKVDPASSIRLDIALYAIAKLLDTPNYSSMCFSQGSLYSSLSKASMLVLGKPTLKSPLLRAGIGTVPQGASQVYTHCD
jgi:hypothetical protein